MFATDVALPEVREGDVHRDPERRRLQPVDGEQPLLAAARPGSCRSPTACSPPER